MHILTEAMAVTSNRRRIYSPRSIDTTHNNKIRRKGKKTIFCYCTRIHEEEV